MANFIKGASCLTIAEITELLRPFAIKYDLDYLILFGSRAQGCNQELSDIDLAVIDGDYREFKYDVNDHARTLLIFDIVDYNRASSRSRKEINTYGKLIYSKTDVPRKGN